MGTSSTSDVHVRSDEQDDTRRENYGDGKDDVHPSIIAETAARGALRKSVDFFRSVGQPVIGHIRAQHGRGRDPVTLDGYNPAV